ncbi:MAG: ORF6N domain-containing protein, partial [Tannerella sp.]|nr:ORF6N domain-containing protein [Tannerella sp.]
MKQTNNETMNEIVKFGQVEEKILTIRNLQVILDSDVAVLYGVETREVNQAIKNNPDKFPEGYILEL